MEFHGPSKGIFTFLDIQVMEVAEFINYKRFHYIALLVDLTAYLSEFNFQLHAENQLVQELYSHVKTLQA
jgi:hypothetical protein